MLCAIAGVSRSGYYAWHYHANERDPFTGEMDPIYYNKFATSSPGQKAKKYESYREAFALGGKEPGTTNVGKLLGGGLRAATQVDASIQMLAGLTKLKGMPGSTFRRGKGPVKGQIRMLESMKRLRERPGVEYTSVICTFSRIATYFGKISSRNFMRSCCQSRSTLTSEAASQPRSVSRIS